MRTGGLTGYPWWGRAVSKGAGPVQPRRIWQGTRGWGYLRPRGAAGRAPQPSRSPGAKLAGRRRRRGGRVVLLLAALLCLAAGTLLIGGQLYLTAKARLAERLIARAFAAQATEGSAAAPWPWADFRPLARLEVPRTGVCRYVLTGGSGTSMAFGIGHLDGTAKPNRPGNCVLVGHRDSWCRFLKALIPGDRFEVTTGAETRAYEMVAAEVVDHQDPAILDPIREGITLVTCYPFDSLRPGPLRYVVHCRPLGDRGQVASEGSSTACRHATLPAPKRALSDGTHVNGVPEGPRRARGSRCRDGW